jgi:hypothetical protein
LIPTMNPLSFLMLLAASQPYPLLTQTASLAIATSSAALL